MRRLRSMDRAAADSTEQPASFRRPIDIAVNLSPSLLFAPGRDMRIPPLVPLSCFRHKMIHSLSLCKPL